MIALDRAWLAAHPLPRPNGGTDKNARGRVLVAGGSSTVPGALRLTGEAALRAGAGKLQLATVASAATMLGMHMPEAAVFPLPANDAGELGEASGGALAELVDRCDALVLGPGTGAKAEPLALAGPIFATPGRYALVIDAAVIDAVAASPGTFRRHHSARSVLTPHIGEMARLMECAEQDVSADPPTMALRAAKRFQSTIVLKGAESWIASPEGELIHYAGGGPGLATAGSGDVLAGIVGGLTSRGVPPRIAAAWAVWLHGEAGRRLATRIGAIGFLARELPGEIPALMNG